MRDHGVEHPGGDDAVLVVDETGFLEQRNPSCGFGRQDTGSAAKGDVLGVSAGSQFNAWIGEPEATGIAARIARGLRRCRGVRVEMAPGLDRFNVATSAAVVLHRFLSAKRP